MQSICCISSTPQQILDGALSEPYPIASDFLKWDPKKEIIKYARWNSIKTFDYLKWNLIKETIKNDIWIPIRTLPRHLTKMGPHKGN